MKLEVEPDRLGMAAQNARGERMEGAEPDPLGGAADHRLEPLAHLARGLVGEGDGERSRRDRRGRLARMCASRVVSTRVLPVPAPASTSTGPSTASTARRCASLSAGEQRFRLVGAGRTAAIRSCRA